MSSKIAIVVNDNIIDQDRLDRMPSSQKKIVKEFCTTMIERLKGSSAEEDLYFDDFDCVARDDCFIS